ncbi:MAG: NAD(P)-dependent oxidoreductase, partial [Verrucomicrobiota bacterium]
LEKRFVGTINWGTGTGISICEIAGFIAHRLGRPELVKSVTPSTPDPFACVIAEPSRLKQLGWQPKVDLPTGLASLIGKLAGGRK